MSINTLVERTYCWCCLPAVVDSVHVGDAQTVDVLEGGERERWDYQSMSGLANDVEKWKLFFLGVGGFCMFYFINIISFSFAFLLIPYFLFHSFLVPLSKITFRSICPRTIAILISRRPRALALPPTSFMGKSNCIH